MALTEAMETLSYLLALDVFSLTAFLMTLGLITKPSLSARKRVQLALMGLVVVRSLYLLMVLALTQVPPQVSGSLEILAALAITLALLKPALRRRTYWRLYLQIGASLILVLSLLWLLISVPGWPLIVALITLGSIPLIFSKRHPLRWSHTSIPILLGLAATLTGLGLGSTSQFLMLIAYGGLVYTIFVETALNANTREREASVLGAETQRQHQERLQAIEVSGQLSASPAPHAISEHIVRVIQRVTQVDQVLLFVFSHDQAGKGSIAAIAKPKAANSYLAVKDRLFTMAKYSVLLDALESQKQITINNSPRTESLSQLCHLCQIDPLPQALIHPLYQTEKIVGILILGNHQADKPVKRSYYRLCQKLDPQLAAMLAYQREYQMAEKRLEALSAETQFRQGQYDQLQDIVETINDGVIASDIDGRVRLVNKAAETMLGKIRDQLLEQPISTIYGDIASRKSIERLATEFSRNNRPLPLYFEQNGHAIQGRLLPQRNRHQEWTGMVAVLRDITSEVQTDETKTTFIRNLSRELRTPLTTVRGYLDLMMQGVAGDLDIQQRHFVQVVSAGVERIETIVNHSQRAIEAETTALKLILKPVNIAEVMQASSQSLQSLIQAKNLQLHIDISENLAPVQADEPKLRQILEHLLSNACRFTREHGHIGLKAYLQSAEDTTDQDQYLILAVSDSGLGIPLKAQRHIFEPYFQVPNELSDIAGGLGLGLSVVKSLVEAHGGRIWVESEEGKGSVFQVALPMNRTG